MKTTRDMLPWTPLKRGVLAPINEDHVRAIAKQFGVTFEEAFKTALDLRENDEIWVNSKYQINIRRHIAEESGHRVVHLSIKRRDRQRVGPEKYRDFMRIKDELVGPECEAVELYPARSREVDTANQYHLFAVDDPAYRFPLGFEDGAVFGPADDTGSVQEPLESAS